MTCDTAVSSKPLKFLPLSVPYGIIQQQIYFPILKRRMTLNRLPRDGRPHYLHQLLMSKYRHSQLFASSLPQSKTEALADYTEI